MNDVRQETKRHERKSCVATVLYIIMLLHYHVKAGCYVRLYMLLQTHKHNHRETFTVHADGTRPPNYNPSIVRVIFAEQSGYYNTQLLFLV